MGKLIRYTVGAANDLLRHGSAAARLRKALQRYASGGKADVVSMRDGTGFRLRVGTYRVIFEETATEILVTKIGPRASVYDD